MRVSDIMTRNVRVAGPDASLRDVAQTMAEINVGALPVCDGDRLLGVVTDRDLVIRALAKGLSPDTAVVEVMTRDVEYCFDDDHLSEVCGQMADSQVRRLPVLSRDHRLVGIVSLGDLAKETEPRQSGKALEEISRNGRPH